MENTWHLRRVADSASKACWICYKPSTSVLITPNNKDFFYICVGHLSDKGFCKPDEAEAAAIEARKEREELDKMVEEYKKERDEKEKLERERAKGKDKDKDNAKEKGPKSKEEHEDKKDEKAKDEKVKELSTAKEKSEANGPRIFQLSKNFYQMRLDKLRNAEIARRNRERLDNPANFPSAPSGNP